MVYYDAPGCTRRIFVPLRRRPVTEPPAGFTDEKATVIREAAAESPRFTAAELRTVIRHHRDRTDITTAMVRYVLGQ
jgi:hypothetical protein